MVKVENAIDMYYAVENANTCKTRKQTCSNYEKRNFVGWKLTSTITAIIDTKNQFSNLYLFWEKNQ